VVLDRDNSPASRASSNDFSRAVILPGFYPCDETEVDACSIQPGSGWIIIPPGLGRDVAAGKPANIQILSMAQSNAALLSVGYVNEIVRRYSQINYCLNYSGKSLRAPGHRHCMCALGICRTALHPLWNGQHGHISSGAARHPVGICDCAEKRVTHVRAVNGDTITALELILAKVIPMIVLEVGGLLIGVMLSFFVFGVAPHGNPITTLALFIALSTLAFLATVGIGIWIATYARNQMQALLITFFVLFPMMFLSGTITPVSAMPIWLQWLSFLSPMRHYLSLALGIFIKGLSMNVVWPHALTLAGFTILILWIGLRRFRHSLE
jgi:ABC-2 type transport system permease protein